MSMRFVIISFCVVFLTQAAQADNLQPIADIEQAAYVHALNDAQLSYNSPQVLVESLDNRLRLQQCEKMLQTFSSSAANTVGSRTIGVKCPAATEWTVYVPVKVKVMKPVVVAAKPLSAHTTLTQADVRMQLMDIAELRQGFLESTAQIAGQQLRYPLTVGSVIPSRGLKQEKVVKRGEQIVLVAAAGTMEVRMNGTALEDASIGDKVRVRNSSSERVVEGIVYSPGIVKVTM